VETPTLRESHILQGMAISGDYSSPVLVNGFSCRNCAEVDKAKRHIDPANPAGGPFGVNDHGKAGEKAGVRKVQFAEEARQPELMDALYKARSAAALSPTASAYGITPSGGTGQFVTLLA
jgi:hypothetical protein